jgi:hypothetical protein
MPKEPPKLTRATGQQYIKINRTILLICVETIRKIMKALNRQLFMIGLLLGSVMKSSSFSVSDDVGQHHPPWRMLNEEKNNKKY